MSGRIESKRLKGAEFLVLAFVVLFLLALIGPVSKRYRDHAFRVGCANNLSAIGKAMLAYANEYNNQLPHSGGTQSPFTGYIQNWLADNRSDAYGLDPDSRNKGTNISSCFYLLIKYEGLEPKTFVCGGDSGTTEFEPAVEGAGGRELADLWDFGPEPFTHCSYSYHLPFGPYPLTTSSQPGMAVAADRNPWIRSPAAREAKDFKLFNPDGGREAVKAGNAITHQDEGQNVSFLDGRVVFERIPFCGVKDDNIYTFWDGVDIRRGSRTVTISLPKGRTDSLLFHDRPRPSYEPPPPISNGDL